jgi:hypothetical protein
MSTTAATIKAVLTGSLTDAEAALVGSAIHSISENHQAVFTDGAGAAQANQIYASKGTLAAAGTVSFNLQDASLTDELGNTIAWTKIKGLLVINRTTNGDSILEVSGDLANAIFGATADIQIGSSGSQNGLLLWGNPSAAGVGVVITTADVITLTHKNDGSISIDYTIVAIGA